MKKLVLMLVSFLLLTSAIPMGLGCSDDDTVEWTLASYADDFDTRTKTLQMFADKVDELSDGKMKIRVSTPADLYPEEQIFINVSNGNCEMGSAPVTFYYEQMPKVVTLTSQAWGATISERMQCYEAVIEMDEFQQECDDNGVIPFGWLSTGWMEFFFTKEVTDLYSDLDGNDLIVSPGGVIDQLVAQVFHATPVQKAYAEIAQAAAQNQIQGIAVMPIDMYYRYKFYEVLPYINMTRTLDYPFPIWVNAAAWNGLDPELKQAVEDAWDATEQEGFDLTTEEFNAAFADLQSNADVYISEMTEGGPEWQQFHAILVGLFEGGLKMQFPAPGYSGDAAAAPTAPDSATVTEIKNIVAQVLS